MPDYPLINQMLYLGHAARLAEMIGGALADGVPVQELLEEGLMAGMAVVGEDFKNAVLYVPEVLTAARAMKAGMAILRPLLATTGAERVGTLLIGTVEGDLHDVGKNLVGMMAEGAGFRVIDLGMDTPAEGFIAAAEEHQPDIIGLSALLTTTMDRLKQVIDAFRSRKLDQFKLVVGGAPVTPSYASLIGADGYAPNAAAAIELFKRLLMEKTKV